MQSEQINELAQALAKAQGNMAPVVKAGKNPHLGNKYVTLDSIIEMARKPLADNGLSFSQLLQQGADGLMLETILMHASGQWLSSEFVIVPMSGNRGVNEMQALGSTLTYLKRYALAAMLGISADEDDDGNSSPTKKATKAPGKPVPSFNSLEDLLFELNQKFGLSEKDAKAKLKELGFTGWPANGHVEQKSTEMYLAVEKAMKASAQADEEAVT